MVAKKLDRRLQHFANTNRLRYTRYFDDLIFSCEKSGRARHSSYLRKMRPAGKATYEVTGELRAIIESEGFAIRDEKTKFRSKHVGQYVTGVKTNTEKLNVSRLYIRNIRAIMHDWRKNGYVAAQDKLCAKLGTKRNLARVVRGRIEHVGYVRSLDRTKSDGIYRKLLDDYRNLRQSRKSHTQVTTGSNGAI